METEQGPLEEFVSRTLDRVLSAVGSDLLSGGPVPKRSGPVDILIPVYNRADLLHRCLEALLPTLADGDVVWLLDDASEEPEVARVAREIKRRRPSTRYVRKPANRGFVDTANAGIGLTDRDIVILNSDTEPCEHWLEHMQDCLARNPRAGIICPISNRATILSVLPDDEIDTKSDTLARAGATTIGDVNLPTAVGFCMLIRRKCLEEIGTFRQAFAPGYGEENDLSMRALRAGWDIVAAERACVLHRSGGSFEPEKSRELKIRHEQKLNHLWPEFPGLVSSWWKDNPLRIKTERLSRRGDGLPGVLHVLHRMYHVGGTERVARSLIQALSQRYFQTLIYPGMTDNSWCDAEARTSRVERELMVNSRWIKPTVTVGGHGADLTCAQSERVLARVLVGSSVEIVHFHHFLHWDSLLLPVLARKLGRRVVISVHDFWFQCPIYNQLEFSSGKPCERVRALADERCMRCLGEYSNGTLESTDGPKNAARFTSLRHALMLHALSSADAVIVPSRFMMEKMLRAFPSLDQRALYLEPHGVRIPENRCSHKTESPGVIAFFGGDQAMKGSEIVIGLAAALQDRSLVFRIFGRIEGFAGRSLPSNIELHGFYDPDTITDCLEGVDLALLPSFYEESFSMVASECWAHGVPVLASARGALKERVIDGINGWLVPDMRVDTWLKRLESLLDGAAIQQCRTKLAGYKVTSIEKWSSRIDRLYQRLVELPRSSSVGRASADPAPVFTKAVTELRARAPGFAKNAKAKHYLGIMRDRWGTAGYRVRYPLEDLQRAALGKCHFHVVREDGFGLESALAKSRAGHVLTQPVLSDDGLRMMEYLHRESGFDVVLVIDDLWTALHADNPVRQMMPANVRKRLAYAASLSQRVVLTTAELERRLGIDHPDIQVINNALPEWVWNFRAKQTGLSNRPGGRLRIGWSGAPQHAADLRFLVRVVADTADFADWVFFGACVPELEGLAVEIHPMVPVDEYPAKLAGLDLDLAVAPLVDTAFNRCKSHLKVLEYGILGWPVVASDLEPYRHCPVDLVSPDDPEAWIERIRGLLSDTERRVERGRSLRNWVLENHMAQHRRPDWIRALGG